MNKGLLRAIKRIASPFIKTYWFLFRPKTYGSKVFIERGKEILFVRHSYLPHYWGLPGGGRDVGEGDEEVARREAKEEVGVTLVDLVLLGFVESTLEYKRDTIAVFRSTIGEQIVTIDGVEIVEAKWFPKQSPPRLGRVTQKLYDLYSASI